MSELKRTVLYPAHIEAGASMVDFGGWEMPIQYPDGIIREHLFCRSSCGLFDVSHMGRLEIGGPDRLAFLQRVLSSNAAALKLGEAQYAFLPDEAGGAIDDAYLHRFAEDVYFLVVNAGNTEKDLAHLKKEAAGFDVTVENVSDRYAAIAVQGPDSARIVAAMHDGVPILRGNVRNSLCTAELDGRPVLAARTGYTGEPVGYELYVRTEDARYLWDRLCALGGHPIGLGARDTLRMEACLPLYGHEMGESRLGGEIPVYSVPLARFAVSFAEEKGDFIGRKALEAQAEARRLLKSGVSSEAMPYRIRPICLTGRGVLRAGCEVFDAKTGENLGYVTSGTMIPYYVPELTEESLRLTEKTGRRSIGLALLKSTVPSGDGLEVDIRGKRVSAAIPPRHLRIDLFPYALPVLYGAGQL